MKKSITLMEVLISLVIITIVMTASLNVQNKSLNIYEKIKNSLEQSSIIATTIFEQEKTFSLFEIFQVKDDSIDKKLKNYKLKIDQEQITKDSLDIPNSTASITTIKTNIILDEQISKSFYRFKIELK